MKVLKKHSRFLAICGGRVTFGQTEKVPIVGVIWRNPLIDKVYVDYITVDSPPDLITRTIIQLVDPMIIAHNHIKVSFFFNTILAGLSIINIEKLYNTWKIPLIFITEKEPEKKSIEHLVEKVEKPHKKEILQVLEENPNDWQKINGTRLFLLAVGIEPKYAIAITRKFQILGHIPEPLRLAKLIASSIPSLGQ